MIPVICTCTDAHVVSHLSCLYYIYIPQCFSLYRHTSYLQESTGIFDPSFLILVHDIRLLLLRFAYEKSFSAESGGGGPQSNLHLIPYLIHIATYILNT